MGKMKERARKPYRGKRKMRSKVLRRNTKASIEDESVVNIVNTPDAASSNNTTQEHVSASAEKISSLWCDSGL